jgi:hypothetical protein
VTVALVEVGAWGWCCAGGRASMGLRSSSFVDVEGSVERRVGGRAGIGEGKRRSGASWLGREGGSRGCAREGASRLFALVFARARTGWRRAIRAEASVACALMEALGAPLVLVRVAPPRPWHRDWCLWETTLEGAQHLRPHLPLLPRRHLHLLEIHLLGWARTREPPHHLDPPASRPRGQLQASI